MKKLETNVDFSCAMGKGLHSFPLYHSSLFSFFFSSFLLVASVIMAALWNRAGHYIFALWFFLLSFFPRLFSAVGDWMSAILLHMVWP